MKKYRIAQIGSFDVENYGDLLFAYVFAHNIEKYVKVDEIVLFAPKRCKMPFTNGEKDVYSVAELEDMHRESPFDAIIVGGGDLVHCTKIRTYMPHISDEWVDYEALYMWMIPSIISWKYDIPLLWNAPGVPMTFMESETMMVRELCKCVDYMSVRDNISKHNLEKCWVDNEICVVPDTVFSVSEIIQKAELEQVFYKLNLSLEIKKYVIFHANYTFLETEVEGCIKTLRKIKENYGMDILLLPIGYALGDDTFVKELTEKCPNEFITLWHKLNPKEMMAVIANSAGYIGASLHGCITAATYGVPIVMCNYNRYIKVNGFLELVCLEKAVVYRTEDIYPVLKQQFVVSEESRRKAMEQIDAHFRTLSHRILKNEKKTKEHFDVALCEYVFGMRTMEIRLQEEIRQDRVRNTQKLREVEYEWVRRYQSAIEAYNEILNSSVWKATAPIRALLKFVKKILHS